MRFIVETDLGHDPDDLLAICHLLAAGHSIEAVSLVPGSQSQVRLANMIRNRTGADFRICCAKENAKEEKLGVHDELMKREGVGPVRMDGTSREVLDEAFKRCYKPDVLIIGPGLGLQDVISKHKVGRITFQGGFLPYSLYGPQVRLLKFEGCSSVPSFNLNGAIGAVNQVLATQADEKRFVGKNVCHTIVLDRERFESFAEPRCEASRLYHACMKLYFAKRKEKKLHDPTALACHLHPEVGVWYLGSPVREAGGWTVKPSNLDAKILADVNRDKLWEHLSNWR